MDRSERFDVVIVGAGLSGCATARALALADPGMRRSILVVDRYRGCHPRFSGEYIHPRGAGILEDLGLHAPLVAAGAVEVDGFVVFEGPDGRRVDLPYASLTGSRPRGISVHHKTLVQVLRDRIRDDPRIELREGWTVKSLVRDQRNRIAGVILVSPTGEDHTIATPVVVGADGKGSTVRKLAGIADERETIGFTAGIEIRDAALPAPTFAHVFLGPWGPILAYPILHDGGGVRCRMTFDLPKDLPVKGRALTRYLLDAYVPHLPATLARQTAAALERIDALEMAPTVDLPAPTAVLPGLALVGDAAGCSHPITASGMTMGLRDAEMLGLAAAARAHLPPTQPWLDGGSLRRYRAEHDRYVPTRQALAVAVYEAFRGDDEGARAIRKALFAYWQSSERARVASLALLSCMERRPGVFLAEYLRTAGFALQSSFRPLHATHFPLAERVGKARGAVGLARNKLGLVAEVMWAQVRPAWLPRAAPPG